MVSSRVPIRRRVWLGSGVALALGAACATSLAQSAGIDIDANRQIGLHASNRIELERVDPQVDAPTGSTARLYRIDQTPVGASSEELRTRWWWGAGAGSLGAGADWAAAPGGSALRPWRPVVGVRADVTSQARLIYEVRAAATPWKTAALPGADNQEVRVAMEFKSARNPAQNLRNGLLRVQLSNTSALMLRPRSGGLVVSYRSQF